MKNVGCLVVAVAVFFITVYMFSGAAGFSFLNWQDPAYVTENPYVVDASRSSLGQAFTIQVQDQYIPLTMLSYAAEQIFSDGAPLVFHTTNIILHGLNAVLVFWLMSLLTGSMWAGVAVALVFALHPARVEAVAWVSGRPDLLGAFFYLAGLIAYWRHIHSQRSWGLPLTYVLFFAAVFAHPHSVSFPLVLILLDWFAGRRPVRGYIREKLGLYVGGILFFMVLVGESVSTLGEHTAIFSAPVGDKLLLFFYSLLTAVGMQIVPLKLSPIYPFPHMGSPDIAAAVWISTVIVVALGYCAWRYRTRLKGVFAGLAWTAISIFVASGALWRGESLWHDHSLYLASLGLYWALAQTLMHIHDRYAKRTVAVFLPLVVLVLYVGYLGGQARAYLPVWRNSYTLWSHAVEAFPNVAAYHLRGAALLDLEFTDLAAEDFTKAILLDPLSEDSYLRRAEAYYLQRQFGKALEDYESAIGLNPDNAQAYFNQGAVYVALQDYTSALENFNKAVMIQPDYARAYEQRGLVHLRSGMPEKAVWDFSKVIALEPYSSEGYLQRAQAFGQMERWGRAVRDYEQVKAFHPEEAGVYLSLGTLHMARKAYDLAYIELSRALELHPDWPQALFARAETLYRMERIAEAAEDVERFLRFVPQYGPAYFLRSNIHGALGRYEEALDDLKQAQARGFPVPADRFDDIEARIPAPYTP